MPAAGYTPILLYGSATASAVPAAANLTNGSGGSEIAINITDGRLYYKDDNGAVQLIGAKLNSVLAAAMSSAPVGTGAVVLASGPTITLPNATGLPLTTGVTGILPIANGGTNATTAPAALTALGAAALAGSTTQAFSVANATATTQAAAFGQTIGAGATQYTNVTASRTLNTPYTNNTGRPLVVNATVNVNSSTDASSAASLLLGISNGSQITGAYVSTPLSGSTNPAGPSGYSYSGSAVFIIPPGQTYMAVLVPQVLSITNTTVSWFEY